MAHRWWNSPKFKQIWRQEGAPSKQKSTVSRRDRGKRRGKVKRQLGISRRDVGRITSGYASFDNERAYTNAMVEAGF